MPERMLQGVAAHTRTFVLPSGSGKREVHLGAFDVPECGITTTMGGARRAFAVPPLARERHLLRFVGVVAHSRAFNVPRVSGKREAHIGAFDVPACGITTAVIGARRAFDVPP